MRVGTRKYIVRVAAAVSQYVCTGMYNTQSNTAQRWHGFSAGIEIDLVVVCQVEK